MHVETEPESREAVGQQLNEWFQGLRGAISRLTLLYTALGDERQHGRCRRIMERLDRIDHDSRWKHAAGEPGINADDWAAEQAAIREAIRSSTSLMVFYTIGYECSEPGKRVIPRGAMTAINQVFTEVVRMFLAAFDTNDAEAMAHEDVEFAWAGIARSLTGQRHGIPEVLRDKLLPQIHEGISGMVRDFKVGR